MKKIFVFLFCLVSIVSAIAKDSPAIIVFDVIEPKEGSVKNTYEDDNISVKFWPNHNSFCMQVYNKCEDRIYIEWENARTNGKRVMFGDDTQITVKQPKSDEAIPANSKSIIRDLYKENPLFNPNYPNMMPFALAIHREIVGLAKMGQTLVNVILPIRFSNNTIKDYKFIVRVKYINTADLSNVKVGTTEKDVKKTIGKADYEKEGDENSKIWVYTNNTELTIKKGKVVKIERIGQ